MQVYHTKHHYEPLIVLPNLELMYFASNPAQGYHICTWQKVKLDAILSSSVARGGSFSLYRMSSGRVAFKITSLEGHIELFCTAWEFGWKQFMRCLKKIQRFARRSRLVARVWRRKRDLVRLFGNTDRAAQTPADVLRVIARMCF